MWILLSRFVLWIQKDRQYIKINKTRIVLNLNQSIILDLALVEHKVIRKIPDFFYLIIRHYKLNDAYFILEFFEMFLGTIFFKYCQTIFRSLF